MRMPPVAITLTVFAVLSRSLSAVPPSGRVVGWGNPTLLQIQGSPVPRVPSTELVPIASQVLTDAVAVAAGDYHSLALRGDGTVFGWGWNKFGQAIGFETAGDDRTNGLVRIGGEVLTNVAAVAAGNSFSLALKHDGSVIGWGKNQVPSGLTNAVAISARGFYSLALEPDGTVVGWSRLSEDKRSSTPAGLSNVAAIASGGGLYQRTLALKRDATVVLWGPTGSMEPVPAGLTNVVAIAAGGGHSLALRRNGTVEGWGDNNACQATGPPATKAPYYSEGTVAINGRTLTDVRAIAAGSECSLALRRGGTVVAWGYIARRPATVPSGLSNVVAIAAGENFCLAITTNAVPVASKR